jgi:hypothetical protein
VYPGGREEGDEVERELGWGDEVRWRKKGGRGRWGGESVGGGRGSVKFAYLRNTQIERYIMRKRDTYIRKE